MHGNEPLGIEIVRLLEKYPIDGVVATIANKGAVLANVRYLENDLNRSFPGNMKSIDYETKRAGQLIRLTKKYDLVLDFHNTHCPENDCVFVGEKAKSSLYALAYYLNLKRVVVADYNCINKFAPNCISIEISLMSKLRSAEFWREQIKQVAKSNTLPKAKLLQKYRFVYRITNKDRDRFNLRKRDLKAFRPISKALARSLGVGSPAYPIFIGDGYTPYNYGGLLNRIK